ncbi:MAG: hypothetical protein ACFFDW_09410 [Candidatus Thorarchaeota archaeon]
MSEKITKVNKKFTPHTKDIVNMFLFLDATSIDNSCNFDQLQLDFKIYQKRFEKLVKNNVIILADEENAKYYLDIERYKIWENDEKKKFFLILVSIIIPGTIIILLGIAWIITIN